MASADPTGAGSIRAGNMRRARVPPPRISIQDPHKPPGSAAPEVILISCAAKTAHRFHHILRYSEVR
jgi:hypothetical protein